MDLDRLSEFLVIAEAGSIKKAAENLGVPVSVLSTRFHNFEISIGAELIHRNAHNFELTKKGKELLLRGKELLDAYDRTLTLLGSVQGKAFRSLRIMLCAQTMAAELGPFLDLYCRRHPRLFLGLYDENNCFIREGLQSGEVDLVFAVGREDDFADISGRIKLDTYPKMKVHVPNDHRLAKAHQISFAELAEETFILYPPMRETHTRDLQLSVLRQSGIPFHIYEEDYSPFFYDLLVPIGKGVRLWNWNDRLAPNSRIITIRDSGYETRMFMLYNTESENKAVSHFVEHFMAFRGEKK